jgi:hypothetical protein
MIKIMKKGKTGRRVKVIGKNEKDAGIGRCLVRRRL